jgi:hypothetical protein
MKIFLLIIASFAGVTALGFHPVLAYQPALPGQAGAGKSPASQRTGQAGQPGSPELNNPLSRPQNTQPKPWEARPWEQAQEELRGEELKRSDPRKMEERRRVGRKARKERAARLKEKGQPVSYEDRVKQRQTRWQRHQLQSDQYSARLSQ